MTHPTLTQSTGPAHTRLLSVGAARGENAVPNDDLVGPIDSSDEWIRQRTGIITRTRAGADVSALDLATDAAREAVERSGLSPTRSTWSSWRRSRTRSRPRRSPRSSPTASGRTRLRRTT
ncbi:hypothetical protein GCM10025870_02740 [Agromyces marinus]|uniref:3-oxoacyl-[acyl-carrier-protein] synthase-3 n=1 Tax=Agromyces marinus TaxID=1389020 RepID=A0ABM8GXH3_9MICO|nr:hypothetical protein GCM10025870_02740 [Agromyces marinus]